MDRRLVKYKFEPMDLANMRQNGIRSLEVMCQGCRHQVVLNVDPYPGELRVTDEQRRALQVLARHPEGCIDAVLLADGFDVGMLAVLVVEGLAE